jgi:methylenetetrahydrofolate reductase (NADPH)
MSSIPAVAHGAAELLRGFSLEMTGKDIPALEDAASELTPGTRVNVTFLASEDLEMRIAAAEAVQRAGAVPVPHISARRLTARDELVGYLDRLAAIGAQQRVLVIGGDPGTPLGPYPDALSVIGSGLLRDHGVREAGIAGYPDGHPDIDDGRLWRAMTAKLGSLRDQGIDPVIITQFGFDVDAVARWIGQVRERGIDAPIRVGVPGPAGVKRLLGYARRFGIASSAGIVEKYGFSLANLLGTAGPDRFVTDLAERLDASDGAVAIHLYPFGGIRASTEWAQQFMGEPSKEPA